MSNERNYTIEFFRIMFAVNFVFVHVLMVFPMGFLRGFPVCVAALDNIFPFMGFSGYFLMQGFRKEKQLAGGNLLSAPKSAGNYLKARVVGLLPVFLFSQLAGFFARNIWYNVPLKQWPVFLLNSVFELTGFQITGLGLGNASVGNWGEGIRTFQVMNAPLWFISGIFVCGYFVYFLLAYNEKLFIGLIAPLSALLFYASQYIGLENPVWWDVAHFGDFNLGLGGAHMFVGMGIGCMIYAAVESLRGKIWSKGMVAFMTIAQIIMMATLLVRTWVPVTHPILKYFNLNWANTHLISMFLTFLLLLNVDKCTRFPLFASKIWKTPGRLAFYVYMLHLPIIVFAAMAMGLKETKLTPANAAEVVPRVFVLLPVSVIASIGIGYIVYVIDTKALQPWMKRSPWFKPAPAESATGSK